MPIAEVRQAYSARAEDYTNAVGLIEHAAQADRDALLAWARGIEGPVLDVGCGPGQWTSFLHDQGIDIEGVDPVDTFITAARARYPEARYRTGRAEGLGLPDGSLGGVLAWFSLIHTDPRHIHGPLAELARCLRPGGSLAAGFFVGADGEPFDHAITTAYFWSVEGLTNRLDRAGFTVVDVQVRTDPGTRTQGLIVAERRPTATPAPARGA
ncbi:class I SAM-dependent methyltransferase [Georgenia phoenicis]|uniref:class I SAM-dependent methyltransferase n=1 Tax=unclassified Georgenia TaxID=2626815 RepID=UPI0039B0C064